MVARAQEAHHRILGRQPAGEGEPEVRPFEQRQVPLEAGAGRVARPGVLEAAMLADGVLLEGGGKVDRGVERSGGGVSRFAAVHRVGLEPESLEVRLTRHRDLTARPSPESPARQSG